MSKMFTWMKQSKLSLLLALIVAVGLLVGGCGGSDSYTDHTVQRYTNTETPLIEAETLKSWMDQGLVNSSGFEKVVILTVGTAAQYETGHIPGALLLNSSTEMNLTRLEGLSYTGTSVSTGSNIDNILQRSGVDRYTTIVISHSGGNMMNPSRIYFTLRYWGIPKEKIKVLNGGNSAWATAVTDNAWDPVVYGLTDTVPVVLATDFSVKEYGTLCPDLRYSLGEMIQAVDQNIATPGSYNILDTRGGTITNQITTAIIDTHSAYYDGPGFLPLADMQERLVDVLGVNPDVKSIVHCASGMRCASVFFVMDALLGWDVGLYDGSTNQWFAYGDGSGANDAWRTDLFGRSQNAFTSPAGNIDSHLNFLYRTNNDPDANQIEKEDLEYITPTPDSSGPPSSVGGGSPSGC